MKASFACNNALPGDILIESETPEELLLFRIFTNWPATSRQDWSTQVCGKEVKLKIKSQGGTESKRHILVGWEE